MWRRHWEQVTPLFAFPPAIRKIVYTTNAVESLHMSLRKIIKTRGSFPSDEAAVLGFAQRFKTMGFAAELEAGPQPFRPSVGSALPTESFVSNKSCRRNSFTQNT
ncbi:MAG: transposase [Acidobacteriaceae bacterium]|nr:transposase [Acidobacteriaceae bacterium]